MEGPALTPLPISSGAVTGGYRIVRHIKNGGMGSTFEAIQIRLDRRVCLKFIRTRQAGDPTIVSFFEAEAKALAKLAHPNIVMVHDFGEHGGSPYIAMEYIDGQTLDEYLANRPLDLRFACRVLESVGSALSYVHSHQIIHRDIKPSNVLVTKSGDIKLADFGLAKVLSNDLGVTETGGIGTPAFAAPEVLQGKRYDQRADVYALGVMAFYLLTGRLPNQGDRPSEANPQLSRDVDTILAKATAPRAGDRYELVKTFVNDLLGALDYSGKLATPERRSKDQLIVSNSTGALPTMFDAREVPTGDSESQPMRPDSAPRLFDSRADSSSSLASVTAPTPARTRPEEDEPVADQGTGGPAPQSVTAPEPAPAPAPSGKSPVLALAALAGVAVIAGIGYVGFRGMKTADPSAVSETTVSPFDAPAPGTTEPAPIEVALPLEPTPTIAESVAPVATPVASPVATPAAPPFPSEPWVPAGFVAMSSAPYTFLTVTESTLWAATINNSMTQGKSSRVYAFNLRMQAERKVVDVMADSQRGISGIAVDEPGNALFITNDTGSVENSTVQRFDFAGAPSAAFGREGTVRLPARPLGIAFDQGRLFVLGAWGSVYELDPTTGATKRSILVQSGAIFRDLAVRGNSVGFFGAGRFVQYDLTTSSIVMDRQVHAGATPRATEGVGVNPLTGEFIVRPPETTDLYSLRDNQVVVSPTSLDSVSKHCVDFAVSPDGTVLYVSDLLNKRIQMFKRGAAPATVAGATAATPAVAAVGGWIALTDANFGSAILESPSGVIAVLHHKADDAAKQFHDRLMSDAAVAARISRLPRLSYMEGTLRPTALPETTWAKTPELLIIGGSGEVIARFGASASPREVLDTMNILDVK